MIHTSRGSGENNVTLGAILIGMVLIDPTAGGIEYQHLGFTNCAARDVGFVIAAGG